MDSKICSDCGLEKPILEFSYKNKSKFTFQSKCKLCHSKYLKQHYKKNKEYYKVRALNRKRYNKKINLEYIRKLKESTPCTDCGIHYPYYIMDFDHISGNKKNIVSAMTQESFELVLAEINKCEIVCANCHRKRTFERSHSSAG